MTAVPTSGNRTSADAVMPIRILLADDERPARRGLRALLETQPYADIVGEARSGAETGGAIRTLAPDLVFLDVQMPEGSGFDVVRTIGVDAMPATIFATGYESFAIAAFEAQALNYLLKPYDRVRLGVALDRVRQSLRRQRMDERLHALLDHVPPRRRFCDRIVVKSGALTSFIPVDDVDWFGAEENYTRVVVVDRSHLIRMTLTALEAQLDPAQFVRVHRSLIVQTSRVTAMDARPSGVYILHLTSGRRLTTGRTYRAAVQAALHLRD